jgi:D-alanyl-D-alanine carboxypeptidase/D-alanyl-D-alanine-endopeptidase (penicillin-binding protein 4)
MTVRARCVALLVLISFFCLGATPSVDAKRRSRRKARRGAPAAVKLDTASGTTLSERLESLLNGSVTRSSDVSVQIVEIESGTVVAERNPNMALAPASNMKLFTTGAAVDLLTPAFELSTTVFARGPVDQTGTLDGDVKIVGHGDPTVGGRFHDGHATAVIDDFATDLKRSGVKTVKGNLIIEYGYMDTEYVHPTWPVNQLMTWYEAPVSAFSMQEGCVQVRVMPSRPGKPCVVQFEPPSSYIGLDNRCVTGRSVPFITRARGSNTISVTGGVPARSGSRDAFITVENPIHYFAAVAHEAFERDGVHFQGQIIITPRDERPDWRAVSQHSTPLSIVLYVINKKSQNHYAEELVKIVGAEKKKNGSWADGTATVTEWLTGKLGVPPGEFHQVDGSGMSKDNRASANAFIHLLRYMWKSPDREDFVSSLPYSGDPDSKFGHRLRTAPYARQVFAKTGYIVGVVGLSGYVHGATGKMYAFSFLFNRYHVGVYAVHHLQDELLKELITKG